MNEIMIQFGIGVAVNIITALLLYFLFERYQKKRDKLEIEKEKKREKIELNRNKIKEEKRLIAENQKIIRATLLSQFPPLIQENNQLQHIAFTNSLIRYDEYNIQNLSIIVYEFRHIANLHLRITETLENLGLDVEDLYAFSKFSNSLAVIVILLFRNQVFTKDDEEIFSHTLKVLQDSKAINSYNDSHLERINILLSDFVSNCYSFPSYTLKNKIEFYCDISEAVGHLCCLYTDAINLYFKKEVEKLKTT